MTSQGELRAVTYPLLVYNLQRVHSKMLGCLVKSSKWKLHHFQISSGVVRALNSSGRVRALNSSDGARALNSSGGVRALNSSGGARALNSSGGVRAQNSSLSARDSAYVRSTGRTDTRAVEMLASVVSLSLQVRCDVCAWRSSTILIISLHCSPLSLCRRYSLLSVLHFLAKKGIYIFRQFILPQICFKLRI